VPDVPEKKPQILLVVIKSFLWNVLTGLGNPDQLLSDPFLGVLRAVIFSVQLEIEDFRKLHRKTLKQLAEGLAPRGLLHLIQDLDLLHSLGFQLENPGLLVEMIKNFLALFFDSFTLLWLEKLLGVLALS